LSIWCANIAAAIAAIAFVNFGTHGHGLGVDFAGVLSESFGL
jgi:hypothetical protein